MRLHIENRGYARAYHPFTLRVFAAAGEQRYLLAEETGANLRWESGAAACETLRLDFRGVPAGEYELCVGLFEGERAVKLAVKAEQLRGGAYALAKLAVKA